MNKKRLSVAQFDAIKAHFDNNLNNFSSPGPWDFKQDTGEIIDKDGKVVCKIIGKYNHEVEANGDLIMLARMLIPLLLDTIEEGFEE